MVISKSTFLIAMIGSSEPQSSLRLALIVVAVAAGIPTTACHRNRSDSQQTAAKSTERSVFTDSAMHVQRCEPIRPGENWRAVCTPKDQGVDYGVRPKKP